MNGRPASARFPLFAAALGLAGAALVILCTSKYGVGIASHDEIAYLSSARNLLAGRGLIEFDGRPLTEWPPLFPTMLAASGAGLVDPVVTARWVNALACGLCVFLAALWIGRLTSSPSLRVLASLAALLATPLPTLSCFAMSDTLFVLLALAVLFALREYLLSERAGLLVLVSIGTALAFLTRYLGASLVLAVGVILLLAGSGVSPLRRFARAAAFGGIAVAPLFLWLLRNHRLTGTLMGDRGPSPHTFSENVGNVFWTIAGWFVPAKQLLPRAAGIALGAAVVLALAAALAFLLRPRERDAATAPPSADLWPLVVFPLVYVAFLVVTASRVAYATIEDRFFAPVGLPLVLLVVLVAERLRPRIRARTRRRLAAAVVAVWLLYPCARLAVAVRYSLREGIGGYTSDRWQRSDLVQYLREHPLPGRVFSNAPDAIYLLANQDARFVARRHLFNSPGSRDRDNFAQWEASLADDGPAYLVWFEGVRRPHLYALDALRARLPMDEVARTGHGAVYRLKPASRSPDVP